MVNKQLDRNPDNPTDQSHFSEQYKNKMTLLDTV